MKKWLCMLFMCLIVQSGALTELNGQSLLNPKFDYLTPDHGLSQSTVESILQDSEGFMWFGTLEGLNKYEGQNKNVVVYKHDPSDAHSLNSNEIEIIYEDRRGTIWIGTDWGGLNKYDREKDHFIRYNAAETMHSGRLSDDTVHALFEDSNGNFWVGTYKGLNLMNRDTETFENYFSVPGDSTSLSHNYINDIYEDRKGRVWVGTLNGLNLMDTESMTFTRYYLDEKQNTGSQINVIFEDSEETLWIGTENGLYIFDPEKEQFINPGIEMVESAGILSITEDKKGVRWVGTENEGLIAIPPNAEDPIQFLYEESKFYGINSNSIYSLYVSSSNILWIGTYDGGVNILNRKDNKFTHYRNIPGTDHTLNENSIFSFLHPQGEELWIGTDGGGINMFNPESERFSAIKHQPGNPNSLSSNVILTMMEDRRGIIWIGTYNGGLVRYNRSTKDFRTYKFDDQDPNSLSHNQIFSVMEDSKGNIWAGTNGRGLNKLVDEEAGVFERWNPNSDTHFFPQYYIRDMIEDEDGAFWVSTYGGGVVHFNPETKEYRTYDDNTETLSAGVVLDIYKAENGTLWAGTKGGGVTWYNPASDQFEVYTTQDGLPNDIVNAIQEDDHGNIWVSTNNGLSKYNPLTKSFTNYDVSDGLQSREFKPGAAYKMPDGTLYFGGINGFNRFHPDSIKENTEVSPVALTDFLLNNKSVSIGGDSPLKKQINHAENIVLPHTASIISFKYSVLNFNAQQGYSYAYMLDGFDSEWNHVGDQNTAIYTNLDPGEYTFKVKTANSDGIWGEQIKQVGLTITPPFWQTYWFYTLAAIFVIGLIVAGVKYRTRQMARINKMLEQQVAERTSELEESNLDLKKAMQDLQETKEELVRNAHKAGMADIATGVLHNIGNVLNSVTTSTSLTGEVLKKSKLKKLFRANELLRENKDNLEEFLTHNPKGQKLAEYYLKLDETLKEEYQLLQDHNKRLEKKVTLINDVIAAQQSYAKSSTNEEPADLSTVIDDALTIYSNSMNRHSISIEKRIDSVDRARVQKTKLVHVIVNLLKNAKDALIDSDQNSKKIFIHLYQKGKQVSIKIADNGPGIKQEDLNKIFTHGFTTKKKGHGFGLHSSANYMTEMGGKLKVKNGKGGQGAIFTLTLPAEPSVPKKISYETKGEHA